MFRRDGSHIFNSPSIWYTGSRFPERQGQLEKEILTPLRQAANHFFDEWRTYKPYENFNGAYVSYRSEGNPKYANACYDEYCFIHRFLAHVCDAFYKADDLTGFDNRIVNLIHDAKKNYRIGCWDKFIVGLNYPLSLMFFNYIHLPEFLYASPTVPILNRAETLMKANLAKSASLEEKESVLRPQSKK